jgi:hypothetical protein
LKLLCEGAPSTDILERIARALMLTNAEHLFLLALGRSRHDYRELDAWQSPNLIGTATRDVVA